MRQSKTYPTKGPPRIVGNRFSIPPIVWCIVTEERLAISAMTLKARDISSLHVHMVCTWAHSMRLVISCVSQLSRRIAFQFRLLRYHIHRQVLVQADAICVYLGLQTKAVTGPRCPSIVLTQVPVCTL
jgi:hypothetical protein